MKQHDVTRSDDDNDGSIRVNDEQTDAYVDDDEGNDLLVHRQQQDEGVVVYDKGMATLGMQSTSHQKRCNGVTNETEFAYAKMICDRR